jgi:hypothetical protein
MSPMNEINELMIAVVNTGIIKNFRSTTGSLALLSTNKKSMNEIPETRYEVMNLISPHPQDCP